MSTSPWINASANWTTEMSDFGLVGLGSRSLLLSLLDRPKPVARTSVVRNARYGERLGPRGNNVTRGRVFARKLSIARLWLRRRLSRTRAERKVTDRTRNPAGRRATWREPGRAGDLS